VPQIHEREFQEDLPAHSEGVPRGVSRSKVGGEFGEPPGVLALQVGAVLCVAMPCAKYAWRSCNGVLTTVYIGDAFFVHIDPNAPRNAIWQHAIPEVVRRIGRRERRHRIVLARDCHREQTLLRFPRKRVRLAKEVRAPDVQGRGHDVGSDVGRRCEMGKAWSFEPRKYFHVRGYEASPSIRFVQDGCGERVPEHSRYRSEFGPTACRRYGGSEAGGTKPATASGTMA
jgi:hypothetical protein